MARLSMRGGIPFSHKPLMHLTLLTTPILRALAAAAVGMPRSSAVREVKGFALRDAEECASAFVHARAKQGRR